MVFESFTRLFGSGNNNPLSQVAEMNKNQNQNPEKSMNQNEVDTLASNFAGLNGAQHDKSEPTPPPPPPQGQVQESKSMRPPPPSIRPPPPPKGSSTAGANSAEGDVKVEPSGLAIPTEYQNFLKSRHDIGGHWNDPPKNVMNSVAEKSKKKSSPPLTGIRNSNIPLSGRVGKSAPEKETVQENYNVLPKPALISSEQEANINTTDAGANANTNASMNNSEVASINKEPSENPENDKENQENQENQEDDNNGGDGNSDGVMDMKAVLDTFFTVLDGASSNAASSSAMAKRAAADTRSRVEVLATVIDSLPDYAKSLLSQIAAGLSGKKQLTANELEALYMNLVKQDYELGAKWLVGVKRLLSYATA